VELFKSFARRLKKEKRKVLQIKGSIREALNVHKRKLKETNDLIQQGFLKPEDLAEMMNYQLKQTKQEIQHDIDIEEGWEALRKFDPDNP
jgi:C4-dicarboxylate-specific signal transduction histidine kinase